MLYPPVAEELFKPKYIIVSLTMIETCIPAGVDPFFNTEIYELGVSVSEYSNRVSMHLSR